MTKTLAGFKGLAGAATSLKGVRLMFEWIIDLGGKLVGYAELLGLKYPVKAYQAKVSEVLWRGSRVGPEELRYLASQGFRMSVNLCAEMSDNAEVARECGLKLLHIPIMDNQPPTAQQMVDFVNAVACSDNQPVYVHCEAGIGRTSVAVACYRIMAQGWTAEQAIEEAQKYGLRITSQLDFILAFGKKNKV